MSEKARDSGHQGPRAERTQSLERIPPDTVHAVVSAISRRRAAGRAGFVVVAHPGDEAPRSLMKAIEDALRAREMPTARLRFAELGDAPVERLARLAIEHRIDVFSLRICVEDLTARGSERLLSLNLARGAFANARLCAILWIPSRGMRVFTDRASNFLDFRSRVIEVGFGGEILAEGAESPRFFVPAPPPDGFFLTCADDITQLEELMATSPRLALIGNTYRGWPGGLGALMRAVLHRRRLQEAASGGVFWIDAGRDSWTAQLELLADRMGAPIEADLPKKLRLVTRFLEAHPQTLLVVDRLREPDRLRRPLEGGFALVRCPGRIVVITPRQDLNLPEFVKVSFTREDPAPKPVSVGET